MKVRVGTVETVVKLATVVTIWCTKNYILLDFIVLIVSALSLRTVLTVLIAVTILIVVTIATVVTEGAIVYEDNLMFVFVVSARPL